MYCTELGVFVNKPPSYPKNNIPPSQMYQHMPPPDTSLIGCCGAYCGTCRALLDKTCKGCKLGYDDGKRDIRAARCAMLLNRKEA